MPRLVPTMAVAMLLCGCATQPERSPQYLSGVDPGRDTDQARLHSQRAVELLDRGQLDQAEQELHKALAADAFYGPGHNNLGNVLYRKKDYYRAAWEYQMAAKLMPKHAFPRNNLGMVFETVGRLQEARTAYEEARKLDPGDVTIAGNLARLRVRLGLKDQVTGELLEEVTMKDRRPEWVHWARQQLLNRPSTASAPATRPS